MKELSIQEKAKRYDEVINRMKHYVIDEYGCSRIKVADVFQELKESEDEKQARQIERIVHDGCTQKLQKQIAYWFESLKERYTWMPSDEQIEAFEHFVRSFCESGYASPYDNNTKLLYSLLWQLNKLKS